MEIEIWKDIEGFEGLYQAGSLGHIKSLDYNHTGRPAFLRPNKTKCGYLLAHLHKNGKDYPYLVSRLVCAAFHPNPDHLPCVNHIDENKENNRADNLEWCTYSYNALHGTHSKRMLETRNKKREPKAEKPVLQLSLDGVEIVRFPSISEAARCTGADHRKISACCHGGRKRHFGYRWAFDNESGKE